MLKHIQLFLKGMAMGAADVVPGVSGGTIAFITGIYERLIGAISSINKQTLLMLFRGQFRQLWTAIDGTFLAVLFAGIFTSILTLASVLTFTLEHYPILTWSFFFGLVAASVWMMGRTVKQWNAQAVVAFVLGTIVAYAITEMNATAGSEAPWYLILSGALAICAMILPGISGSFILLLLGAYSTVLAAVANRELLTIAYVGIGAVLGLLLFSKGLKYIFERFYNPTIALLSGFLLGSLNKLWPWKETLETFVKHAGTEKEEIVALSVRNLAPEGDWPTAVVFALLGAVLVLGLEYAGKKDEMIKLGLIGTPIAHSLSPEIHQGFMTAAGISGSYDLFEMPTLPKEGLKAFMQHHGLVGLNVTIPFKEEVFNALDSVDDVAKTLGAVNTVVLEKNRLVGYNTDVYGIEKSLMSLGCPPCKALVFGSGGAAKAVSKVLKANGFEALILSRGNPGASYDDLSEEVAAECKLWVNCTPVGTAGIDPHLLPLPYAVLSEEFAIFDLVYKPNPTPLMKEGLQRGARVLGGEKMLIEQAKKSWQLFHDAYYKNL